MKSLVKTTTATIIVLSLLTMMGCAFGTREVTLRNSVADTSDSLKPPPPRAHAICFNNLEDKRPDSTIGHVQNSYGMHTAEVVALNSVPEWVNKEIEIRLRSAGYDVTKNCGSNNPEFIINGSIMKVYTTAYSNYLGEVTIKAAVSLYGSTLTEKKYTGHKKTGINWAATGESYGVVLENSLGIALTELIADIDSLDNGTNAPPASVPTAGEPENTLPPPLISGSTGSAGAENLKCPDDDQKIVISSPRRSIVGVKPVIDTVTMKIQHLYRERFELDSTLSGKICVYFPISSDGTTGNITIIESTLNDRPIELQLHSLLSNAKFGRIQPDMGTVGVTCSFSFSPKAARASKGALTAVLLILALIPLTISIITLSKM